AIGRSSFTAASASPSTATASCSCAARCGCNTPSAMPRITAGASQKCCCPLDRSLIPTQLRPPEVLRAYAVSILVELDAPSLEGRRPGPVILRGSLRSRLRMTGHMNGANSMPDTPARTSQNLAALCAADGEFHIASRNWTGGLRLEIGASSVCVKLE